MPEVVARVHLQETEASGARIALEVDLERAFQGQRRHNTAAQVRKRLVVRKLDIGTRAGERWIGAQLAADEPAQQLAVLVAKTVKRPDLAVVAPDILLNENLVAQLLG